MTAWIAATSALLLVVLAVLCTRLARQNARLKRHARAVAAYRASIAALRHRWREQHANDSDLHWNHIREAAAPVVVATPEGKVLVASAGAVKLFGFDNEQEFARLKMEEFYWNPLDRAQYLDTALRTQEVVRNREFRMRRRDGGELRVLTTVRTVKLPGGQVGYEGVLTDITALHAASEERRQLEEQLHLARKMELVGRLASGIAHEINTPMQFIGDNVNFLRKAFAQLTTGNTPAKASKELLTDIDDALVGSLEGVERVSETVRAMKEFAHPGDLEVTSTDINAALRTTLVVARNEYKHAADLTLELGDIPPVDCRRAELSKVFLNLVVNAAHAIESTGKRGTITIRTRVEGERVVIDIADSGCGIPPAVLPRIFDPFFTTKAVGKGTGQGLAIASEVVAEHGGTLGVASTVGVGTTFSIRLPASPLAQRVPTASVRIPMDLRDDAIG